MCNRIVYTYGMQYLKASTNNMYNLQCDSKYEVLTEFSLRL